MSKLVCTKEDVVVCDVCKSVVEYYNENDTKHFCSAICFFGGW